MNVNPNHIESTNENKKPIRPRSSSNKFIYFYKYKIRLKL